MTARDSIIINTRERPETLNRCLDALVRQPGIEETEVIVVDDGSRGNFDAIPRLWKRRLDFKFIPIPHSGRAVARNRGAAAAKGERLLFLGDDVMVRPGWLARHLELGRGQRMRAVLGPYPLTHAEAYPPAFANVVDPVHLDHIKNPTDVGFEFFLTGNISMDRELFHEIGGFDARFQVYGWEDIDFGLRFKQAGGTILYDENARAVHEHPRMSHADLWRREFEHGYTAWIFHDKWGDLPEIQPMKFWRVAPAPGAPWKRRLGGWLIAMIEKSSPNSALLPRLYERMIYSLRHAGALKAKNDLGASSSKSIPASGVASQV